MTYTYAPNEGDDTLFVKQLDGDKLYRVPVGEAAGGGRGGRGGAGGGSVQFSDDAHWIGYYVNPPAGTDPVDAARDARGAAGGAVAPTAPGTAAPPALRTARPRPRATSSTSPIRPASSSPGLALSGDQVAPARGDTSHRGSDLLLRRLADGVTQNIGNVNQYDFDTAGNLLAYTVDAATGWATACT